MIDPAQAFWIGHPGSLLPLYGAKGSLSREADQGVVIGRGMGGGVRARVPRGRAARSWDITLPGSRPGDVKHLETLLTATLPPYALVTAEAQVSNVLTPERSVMSDSNPSLALGGWWPIVGEPQGGGALTRLNPSAAFGNAAPVYVGPAPIPPPWTGRKVTASILTATARAAGVTMSLAFLNAAGFSIRSVQTAGQAGMDGLRRSTVTETPPPGAVACEIYVRYAEVIAQPQITWTDHPVEWTVGQGVDSVVVESFSSEQVLADTGRDRRISNVSFTATEVGP